MWWLLLGLLVVAGLAIWLIPYLAPKGYEDEDGFHYGDKDD